MEKNSKKKSKDKETVGYTLNRTQKAGITFPVNRVLKHLKAMRDNGRTDVKAAIYTAAVLEYLTAELLEIAGRNTVHNNKSKISPRHILLAIKEDEEFNKLLNNITICDGGVVPT